MILTDYYKFEHLQDTKSKSRFDCTCSTGSYEALEILRNKGGELFVYYTDVPEKFNSKVKADKCLTKTKNISSLFVPDVNLPFAYGDINSTLDGILIKFSSDYSAFELFIARGQKNNKRNLYFLLVDGELNSEIDCLRNSAMEQ